MTHWLLLATLAQAPDAPTIRPPAREIQGGVAIVDGGETVNLQPGDCYVPRARCVAYVKEAEACFAEKQVLQQAPAPGPIHWWVVAVIGVASFGAGVALAQALSP